VASWQEEATLLHAAAVLESVSPVKHQHPSI
jgi:hypothetical protein